MAGPVDSRATTGTQSSSAFGVWSPTAFQQLAVQIPYLSAIGLTGSADVLNPHTSATYTVNTAGVDAMTLAAPTAGNQADGGDSGIVIIITSGTSNAHTLTATGLLGTGTASVNVATFAAFSGAGLTLRAHKGKWLVLASVGITFS